MSILLQLAVHLTRAHGRLLPSLLAKERLFSFVGFQLAAWSYVLTAFGVAYKPVSGRRRTISTEVRSHAQPGFSLALRSQFRANGVTMAPISILTNDPRIQGKFGISYLMQGRTHTKPPYLRLPSVLHVLGCSGAYTVGQAEFSVPFSTLKAVRPISPTRLLHRSAYGYGRFHRFRYSFPFILLFIS
jgi:hypothetical protein